MDLEQFKKEVTSKKKWLKNTFRRIQRLKPDSVDQAFHEAHEEAFNHIDCLTCANCCKTTGPLFTTTDIRRIAKQQSMSEREFEETYLLEDEEGDYVLQSVPCPFLGEDNYCTIYEYRPKACREFPHTDRRNMKQILHLTRKNAEVCPAVYRMIQKIEMAIPTLK